MTLSREEFVATLDRLYATTDGGFEAIKERLDLLNGRTLAGEIERENLRTRVVSLEKEVFNAPRRRTEDTESRRAFFSKKETGLIALGLAAVTALVKLALVSGELIVELVKTALKAK